MFNPDKPITKEKDEKLNRLNFIKNLSFAINHYDNKECLVIGLLGEWGSGKTSILNLAMNQINENREIFRYNPWIFSEENDLILNFFIELLEIIKKIESKNENDHELVETTKELSENITQYLKKFFNKSTISGNITLLHGISIGGSFTPNWEEKSLEESLGDLKEKINQGLKILDKKIIIIIDDIDRLSDNEVKQIFKLVKTVADFKNTIYILSFDKNMILNSLNKVQSYSSEKYLEKIIPIQIEVPEIDRTKLQKYFEDELIETLTTNEIEMNYEDFITISFNLRPFISNIRDINRFNNHLIFYLPFLKQEVNISNYLMILALQLFEDEIYNEIKNNKRFFAGTNSSSDRNERETINKNLNEIIAKNKKLGKDEIKNILFNLFPKLSTGYGSSWLKSWREDLRICHPDYFDKYFTLTIPENEISQRELNILFNFDNYESILDYVMELNKIGKSRELLEKIVSFNNKIPPKNIKNFIKLIIEKGDELDITYKGLFYQNEHFLVPNALSILLEKLDKSERLNYLKQLINNLNRNIFTIISFIKISEKEIENYGEDDFYKEKILLDKKQLKELNNIMLEKINMLAKTDELLDCYNLDEILYYWSKIENEKVVSEFLEESLNENKNSLKIIKGFEIIKSSRNLSEVFERVIISYTFTILERFIDLNKFKEIVLSIKNPSKDDKINIENFINELEKYLEKDSFY